MEIIFPPRVPFESRTRVETKIKRNYKDKFYDKRFFYFLFVVGLCRAAKMWFAE